MELHVSDRSWYFHPQPRHACLYRVSSIAEGGTECERTTEDASILSSASSFTSRGLAASFVQGDLIAPQRLSDLRVHNDRQDLLQERQRLYTPSEKAHAFRQASETIRSYSDETVERWNKEIKDYLILVGRFICDRRVELIYRCTCRRAFFRRS
ncbi:hypothetical protein BV20DRAFT_966196 [Pilatotrama ljubarskyi]|nr:hypothetical protein BV20DRAFT_966196 [Pilatotrama ljubarskyi]